MTFYEIRSFKVKSLRRPYGYLARAYINGVYVEQYYEWKPTRQRALEDLTTRYDFNKFAAQALQRNMHAGIIAGKEESEKSAQKPVEKRIRVVNEQFSSLERLSGLCERGIIK